MKPGLHLKDALLTVITGTRHSARSIDHNMESFTLKCTLMHVNNMHLRFLYCTSRMEAREPTLPVFIRVGEKEASVCSSPHHTSHGGIQFLSVNRRQVKLLPAEFHWGESGACMQWGGRHTWRGPLCLLQLRSELYLFLSAKSQARGLPVLNHLSVLIYSLWHFVPTISFAGIVCANPLLTAERTNNTSGLTHNRLPLIAGTRSEPPTASEREVRLEKSQMFIQMLLAVFWLMWEKRLSSTGKAVAWC